MFSRITNRPALIDGLSLNGTSLHQLRHGRQTSHKVRVILNVENWSRFTLLDSQTDLHCGEILQQFQAPNVYPGYREVMLGVGTKVFSGTCGTVSWQVRLQFYSWLLCSLQEIIQNKLELSCPSSVQDRRIP